MPNATATISAPTNDEPTITFDLYSTAGDKEYYEIISNSIPTQKFVEVPVGSKSKAITDAYKAGNIVG